MPFAKVIFVYCTHRKVRELRGMPYKYQPILELETIEAQRRDVA